MYIDEEGLFCVCICMCYIPDFPHYLSLNQHMLEVEQPYVPVYTCYAIVIISTSFICKISL